MSNPDIDAELRQIEQVLVLLERQLAA